MKKLLCWSMSCCFVWLGCGSSDELKDDEDPMDRPDAEGCTVLPGLPGSGEYLLKCPDGTQVKLKTARDGEEGDSCTIRREGEQDVLVCPDGTRAELGGEGSSSGALRVVRREEPAGEHCAAGGQALELYEEGSQQPLEVFYECAPSCEPGRSLDAALGRCVTLAGVRFEGVVEEGDASMLPASMRPAGGLVSNVTPCSGSYRGPLDLVPLEGQSAGIGVATYVFGHVSIYELVMEVGGVRYGRDLELLDPTALKMSRGKGYAAEPMAEPPLEVRVEAAGIKGLEELESSKVELRGEVAMSQRGPMTYALPASVEEWTPLLMGSSSPHLVLDASDFLQGGYAQISCRIERFLPLE